MMRYHNALRVLLVVSCAVGLISCGEKATDTGGGGGEAFQVEIENFSDSFDMFGSTPISRESCSTASGGRAVAGLDRPGEWIEIPLSVPKSGVYNITVRYAAPLDSIIDVQVSSGSCGDQGEADFTLDKGLRTG